MLTKRISSVCFGINIGCIAFDNAFKELLYRSGGIQTMLFMPSTNSSISSVGTSA